MAETALKVTKQVIVVVVENRLDFTINMEGNLLAKCTGDFRADLGEQLTECGFAERRGIGLTANEIEEEQEEL